MTYHSLEGNFEGSNSGKNLVGLGAGVVVGNQLAVDLIVNPGLGDLVDEDNASRSDLLNLLGH